MTLTQISTAGVKDDAVTSGKIPANAVGSSELADNAVDTAAIADDAVTAAKIADNSITATQLAADSVGYSELAVNAVGNENISSGSISSGKMASDSVATAAIQDQAVTLAKLPHGDGSSDGKFLRANNGADPTFESVPSPAITGISNATNNRILTSEGGTTVNCESTLTYNGSGTLEISDSGSSYTLRGAGVTKHGIDASSSDNDLVIQNNKDAGNITSNIIFKGSGSGGATISEKMRITNTSVGINHDTSGTSTNAALTIKNRVNSSATRFNLVNTGSSSAESTQIFSQNNELAFTASGSERFRITSGGVLFNGDTASANKLDDYEEGTFTPSFQNGLVASSYESNGQKGVYTKIGRYVFGTILLHLAGASAQNSNVIDIHGLPFTAGVSNTIGGQAGGCQYFYQDGFYNSRQFAGIVVNNTTRIRLYKKDDGSYLTGSDVNGGREIRLDFSYHAA